MGETGVNLEEHETSGEKYFQLAGNEHFPWRALLTIRNIGYRHGH